jgi:hypothetical protein
VSELVPDAVPSEGEPGPPAFWNAIGLTFGTAVRNARTCLALVSVYAALYGVINAIGQKLSLNDFDPLRANSSELIALTAASLVSAAALFLVTVFVAPPTNGALSLIGEAAVAGDVLETHGIVRRVFDRALEVIGAFVLTALIPLACLMAAGIAAAIVALAVNAEAGVVTAIFLVLVLAVPAIYAFVRLLLAVPVVVIEGLGPIQGLRRSWDLVGGSWWWTFGVFVAVGLVATIIGEIVSGVLGLGTDNAVLSAVGAALAAAVQASLLGVAGGVIYASRARVKPPAELRLEAEQETPPAT